MHTTQPTLDEWRGVYEANIAFKELAPWEWMTEADIIGIEDPQTGQLSYASIMGMAFALPTAIQEKGDPRPYIPYNLLMVEAKSGFVLGTNLLVPKPSLEAVWAGVPAAFVQALARLRWVPTRVTVSSEQLYHLLEFVPEGLGIHLTLAQSLPALEEARASLRARMR